MRPKQNDLSAIQKVIERPHCESHSNGFPFTDENCKGLLREPAEKQSEQSSVVKGNKITGYSQSSLVGWLSAMSCHPRCGAPCSGGCTSLKRKPRPVLV